MDIHPTHIRNPEILRFLILSTVSYLQSDNDVITSNSPPARNIVVIYLDYFIETYKPKYRNTTRPFLYLNIETKNVAYAKTLKSVPYFCEHPHGH